MHHAFDVYAYKNPLGRLPAAQNLLFGLGVLAIALVAQPLTHGLIILWLMVWTIGYGRIPVKVYRTALGLAVIFLLFSLPALVLEVAPHPSWPEVQADTIAGIPWGNGFIFISRGGLRQSFVLLGRSLACFSCLLFIVLTIPFAKLLALLRQCWFPPILLDLFLLMHRFVFLFLDVAMQLQLAQKARGGYRTRQLWLKSVALLVGQLVIRSLHRYQQFALGLKARGFQGEFIVTSLPEQPYSRRYVAEAIVGCLGLVVLDWHWRFG